MTINIIIYRNDYWYRQQQWKSLMISYLAIFISDSMENVIALKNIIFTYMLIS